MLVVDDSDDNREMCAECLSLAGFRVLQARTGREALALAARADVVLMDLALPEIDGIEAARLIRRDPCCARVALVALTGMAVDDVAGAALRAGFDRVLGKPCLPDALAHALREQIR